MSLTFSVPAVSARTVSPRVLDPSVGPSAIAVIAAPWPWYRLDND
jgi:hypothetical protein